LSTLDHASCPQCQQVITRARQIVRPTPGLDVCLSKIDSSEGQWPLRPPIPPLPEVVPIQNEPSGREGSIWTSDLKSKRLGFFSHFTKGSAKKGPVVSKTDTTVKREGTPRPVQSITPLGTSGGTLPRYLSFCFSLSGKNLILWKKDSQALVRIEVESSGSRLLDLTDMLPASNEARAVNIRYVAEGNDWICALITHNRVCFLYKVARIYWAHFYST
jgi:hypothetical protein